MRLTKIKLLRLRKGLYQWQLASRLGIAENQMSKIETGRLSPPEELLARIAEELGVPLDRLRERKTPR